MAFIHLVHHITVITIVAVYLQRRLQIQAGVYSLTYVCICVKEFIHPDTQISFAQYKLRMAESNSADSSNNAVIKK